MPEVSPPPPDQPHLQQQHPPELSRENVEPLSSQAQSPGIPTFTFRKPSTNDDLCDDDCESASLMRKGGGDGGGGGTGVVVCAAGEPIVDPRAFCLQVHSVDVCRICQCGPNTLATPTPLLLTPITSPKKRFSPSGYSVDPENPEPTSSTLNAVVTIELKRSMRSPDATPPQLQSPTQHHQLEKGKGVASSQLSPDYNLISPCVCSGSLKYVHQCCLQNWIRASNNTACELCKHPFQLRSKFKPLWKWESLPMVPGEKKRIVCSAMFHTLALACVVWSLYVLIDRTIEELNQSDLEWQFWTKIIVEAIGCLGAGILTYVWGKSYMSLLVRWISFNRSFVIIGKECPIIEPPPPPQIIVDGPATTAAATTSHNQESAREQELINLIN